MKLLNRAAFSIVPKVPFVDWTQGLELDSDELHTQMSLEEHQREGSVYLIEEVESEADFDVALSRHWAAMFESELAAWDEFGDQWPEGRSQAMFEDWFEIKPQLVTFDLLSAPILTAEV